MQFLGKRNTLQLLSNAQVGRQHRQYILRRAVRMRTHQGGGLLAVLVLEPLSCKPTAEPIFPVLVSNKGLIEIAYFPEYRGSCQRSVNDKNIFLDQEPQDFGP